jgi:hypothetical protein
MCRQDSDQERAMASAYVDNALEPREIIGSDDRIDVHRQRAHRRIEHSGLVSVLGQVLEELRAVDVFESRLPGPNCCIQLTAGPPDKTSAQHHGPSMHRLRMIDAKRIAESTLAVPTRMILYEDPQARKCTKQAS